MPYTTLSGDADSFRILVIEAGTGSEPIRCSLESARLSSRPAYHALSYYWGDQSQLEAIFVNNIRVAITRNLWLALVSLREADEDTPLWADAICINQQDDLEKASQIPIMGSVYQGANSVIIYLGDHKPYNNRHRRLSPLAAEVSVVDSLRSSEHSGGYIK